MTFLFYFLNYLAQFEYFVWWALMENELYGLELGVKCNESKYIFG